MLSCKDIVRSSWNIKLWLLLSHVGLLILVNQLAIKGFTRMKGVIDWIFHEEIVLLLHNIGSEEYIWSLGHSQHTSWYCHDWKNSKGTTLAVTIWQRKCNQGLDPSERKIWGLQQANSLLGWKYRNSRMSREIMNMINEPVPGVGGICLSLSKESNTEWT